MSYAYEGGRRMMPKYRAWDKDDKVMRIVNEIHFGTRSITCMPLKDHDDMLEMYDPICFEGHYELMQSTGLKDKNGVEIFEGDIVKCTVDNWSNGEKFEQIDKVVYEDCMFTFSDGFKYDCSINHPSYLNKEVIGNIFENPELLEVR